MASCGAFEEVKKFGTPGTAGWNGTSWGWRLCKTMEAKEGIKALSWSLQNEVIWRILGSRKEQLNFCFGKLTLVADWRQDWKKAIVKTEKPFRKLPQLSRWKMVMTWTRVLSSLRPSIVLRAWQVLNECLRWSKLNQKIKINAFFLWMTKIKPQLPKETASFRIYMRSTDISRSHFGWVKQDFRAHTTNFGDI